MFDVVIIGAGVTGSAIAREISRYKLKACVIEKEEDVCNETSKANSAIIHAGFDAVPGTEKAKLNVIGNSMMDQIAEELDIPFKRNGSLVVCTKEQDPEGLQILMERGKKNGVPDLQILNREELLKKEPNIADDVTCALWAPTGGIVCPFHMTMGYAENAYENGVQFFLNTKVEKLEKTEAGFTIQVHHVDNGSDEMIETRIVVNAAGVYADEINNQLSDRKLHITARKGEYMLLDKTVGDYVKSTIFQLPSKMGKGVLVTPTVHGNLLVGPTAVNVEDKDAVNTTMDGLNQIAKVSSRSVKNVPFRQVITSFAGLRAHEDGGDFQIEELTDVPGFIDVAGIESPGLTSAPAIGVYVCDLVKKMMEDTDRQINPGDSGNLRSFEVADKQKSSGRLQEKENFIETRKGIVHFAELSLEEQKELIQKNPAYGQVICRCETVTEGEILDAIRRPLGARTLDGVKRRVRAGMGRCQGGFCTPRIMEILSRECGIPLEEICKNNPDSRIIVGTNKDRL